MELHLLGSCLSLCKINHLPSLLRTVSPEKTIKYLSEFDASLRRCLESIANSSITGSCWSQATLSIRLSGLGLREAYRSSSAAFLGSCNATRALSQRLMNTDLNISFNSSQSAFLDIPGKVFAQELLQELLPDHEFKPEIDTQHHLHVLLDNKLWSDLKQEASIRDHARMSAISAQHTVPVGTSKRVYEPFPFALSGDHGSCQDPAADLSSLENLPDKRLRRG